VSNPQNQSAGIGNSAKGGGFLTSVFPATVNTADPAALTDTNVSQLSLDAAGNLRVRIGAIGSGLTFTVVPFVADAVGATARVVAPAAGTVIVTIAAGSLPAGYYAILVGLAYDAGVPAAPELNNMELRAGAVVVSALQIVPAAGQYAPTRRFARSLDGATALSVNATGNATAGVGYTAELIAVRLA